jgi:hypothetical protein
VELDLTEQEALQIFDGVMLSDGTLVRGSTNSVNYILKVSSSGTEHEDWLLLIRDALAVLDIGSSPISLIHSTSRGKPYSFLQLRSRLSEWLSAQRQLWYPLGIKIVPESLILAPLTTAVWFMGDGSSIWSPTGRCVIASFATHGFSEKDVEHLESQLRELGVVDLCRNDVTNSPKTERQFSSGITLQATRSVSALMNMMEPFILPSFSYKIKHPTTKERLGACKWQHAAELRVP